MESFDVDNKEVSMYDLYEDNNEDEQSTFVEEKEETTE